MRIAAFFVMAVSVMAFSAQAVELPISGGTIAAPVATIEPTDPDDASLDMPLETEQLAADPWEGVNRPIFGFNRRLDTYLIKPLSQAYHWTLPEPVRDGVGNVFDNLSEPVKCINGLLQADAEKTFTHLWRFILNTTFGFGGIRDFAGENGLAPRKDSFGDTLQVYGVNSGPYFVAPLFGPSNPRDAFGLVMDFVMDPFTYIAITPYDTQLIGVDIVDQRDQNAALLDEVYGNALEPYVAMRSAYQQNRHFASRGGKIKQLDN